MPNVTLDKNYRTRDGRAARVLCIDRQGTERKPVLALVTNPGTGEETTLSFFTTGHFSKVQREHRADLIEIVPDIVNYRWLYANTGIGMSHDTEAEAEARGVTGGQRVGLLKIVVRGNGAASTELLPN